MEARGGRDSFPDKPTPAHLGGFGDCEAFEPVGPVVRTTEDSSFLVECGEVGGSHERMIGKSIACPALEEDKRGVMFQINDLAIR